MKVNQLTEAQKRYLRGLAHPRKPIILIGVNGLGQNVIAEIDQALAHHELLKIRVRGQERDDRDTLIALVCEQLNAQLVQRIGHIATLYRHNPEKSQFNLPNGS